MGERASRTDEREVGISAQVRDRRLAIGERTAETAGALTPLGQDARIAALHADVREVADRDLERGHREAITGLDLDGSKLMGEAFADSNPAIALADISTETGPQHQSRLPAVVHGRRARDPQPRRPQRCNAR
jgi:hypothetical protein